MPLIFLSYNFIRLGLTLAKALQTVSRFSRETRRRSAAPKSYAVTLSILLFYHFIDNGADLFNTAFDYVSRL